MCSSRHDRFPSFVAFPHNFLRLHILVFHTVVPESICFWIIKQVDALGKSLHPLLPLDVLRVRNWGKASCVFGDCCSCVRVGCNADGICNMLCSGLCGEPISGTQSADPDWGIIYRVSGCCRNTACFRRVWVFGGKRIWLLQKKTERIDHETSLLSMDCGRGENGQEEFCSPAIKVAGTSLEERKPAGDWGG